MYEVLSTFSVEMKVN